MFFRPAKSTLTKRAFKTSSFLRGFQLLTKADLVTDLYLKEIRQYKPKPFEKINLPNSFVHPKPPAAPAVEYRGKEIEHAAVEADEWPALVDPIDNPELYNFEYDISTENDDGTVFPKRTVPFDYH